MRGELIARNFLKVYSLPARLTKQTVHAGQGLNTFAEARCEFRWVLCLP
jgi:hypothetical protein